MSAEFMRRNIKLSVRLTEDEQTILKSRMAMAGTTNQEAFIRKMVLDGMIVRLDVPELKEMISLLRYSGNNINQLTKHLHSSGRIYETDLHDIQENQNTLIALANNIIMKLSAIR